MCLRRRRRGINVGEPDRTILRAVINAVPDWRGALMRKRTPKSTRRNGNPSEHRMLRTGGEALTEAGSRSPRRTYRVSGVRPDQSIPRSMTQLPPEAGADGTAGDCAQAKVSANMHPRLWVPFMSFTGRYDYETQPYARRHEK